MRRLQWREGYILGLVGISVLLFRYATPIGILVFISILLSLLLYPLKKFFERRVAAGVAAAGALLCFIGLAGVLFKWILDNLSPGLKQFATNAPVLINRQAVTDWIAAMNLPATVSEYTNHLLDNARDFAFSAVQSSLVPALHAVSGLVELVAVPFIMFYFLKDHARLRGIAISFVPPQERPPIEAFFSDIADMLGGYIKGQVAVCLTLGGSVFLFFHFMDLPHAAIFGALSAVGELIPVLGPIAITVFAAMYALTFSTSTAVMVVLFYIIMLKLNNTIIYPQLIGKAVRLHPVFIMIGLLLFGSLFGALGMIVAVPVMGLLRVVCDHLLPKR